MKRGTFVIVVLMVFLVLVFRAAASEVRVPEVGGDSGDWGRILNLFLMNLTNPNASSIRVGNFTAIVDSNFTFSNLTSEMVRIDSTGKVGIGFNNPLSLLDVAGEIRADDWTNVTITQSQISDFAANSTEDFQKHFVNITGDTMTGNLNMSGKNITNINTILGNGTYVRIGDGGVSASGLTANDDLLVTGKLESTGVIIANQNIQLLNGREMTIGGGNNGGSIYASTPQTPDTAVWGLGTGSNSLLITTQPNRVIDYGHPKQNDPTLFIHSNQSASVDTSEWISFAYLNATNEGRIETGKGNLTLKPASGNVDLRGGNLTMVNTILGNGSYVRIGDAGVQNQLGTPVDDDLFISGKLEVDGAVDFDNLVDFHSTVRLENNDVFQLGTGTGTQNGLEYDSTAGQLLLGLTTNDNQFVIIPESFRAKDFNHAKLPDPTLYIHSNTSPDDDNTEWISFAYLNATDEGRIETGKGNLVLNPAGSSINMSGKNISNVDFIIGNGGPIKFGEDYTAAWVSAVNDVSIKGKLETIGIFYPVGNVVVPDNQYISFGNSQYSKIQWDTTQTEDATVWALGDQGIPHGFSLIVTRGNNLNKDHVHTPQPDPTLFIHSNTSVSDDTTEWISFAYLNATDEGQIETGKGNLTLNPASGEVKIRGNITFNDGGYIRDNGTALILGHG